MEAQRVPVEQRHLRDLARGMTLADVEALKAGVPDIEIIAPEMRLELDPTLQANGKFHRTFMTGGVVPEKVKIMEHEVEHGRMFNDIDASEARPVCVIGTGIRDELFGRPEEAGSEVIPLGRTMTINGQPFTIIGMFKRYEGEQERKQREEREAERLRLKAEGKVPPKGPARGQGRSGNFAFWIKNNMIDEILTLLLIGSGLIHLFSKEKQEDEFIMQLRFHAMKWSYLLNFTVHAIGSLLVYGLPYFNVMLFCLFSQLVCYHLVFRIFVLQHLRK
jgi:hypothetical protein